MLCLPVARCSHIAEKLQGTFARLVISVNIDYTTLPDNTLTRAVLTADVPTFLSKLFSAAGGVRVMSRSASFQWGSIRFRSALHTYAPWGVRVVSLTTSRKIPTR